jgi:hypothetical protein
LSTKRVLAAVAAGCLVGPSAAHAGMVHASGVGPHGDPVNCTVQTTAPVRGLSSTTGTTVATCEGDVGDIWIGAAVQSFPGPVGLANLWTDRGTALDKKAPSIASRLVRGKWQGGQTVATESAHADCKPIAPSAAPSSSPDAPPSYEASPLWNTFGWVYGASITLNPPVVTANAPIAVVPC